MDEGTEYIVISEPVNYAVIDSSQSVHVSLSVRNFWTASVVFRK